MSTASRLILIVLVTVGIASPVLALRSPSQTNLEEINHHQAAATAALLQGGHTLLEQGEFSITGHVHVSGWGTDALYGAWGFSLQARPGRRLGLGLSYGKTEAQLHTQVWLLNANYAMIDVPDPWLQLQGAIGHQYLDSSESKNVMIFEFDQYWPIRPGNPLILLDDMHWTHGYLNVLLSPRFWIFRPQTSLGFVYSHYSWSGWEVPTFGGLDEGPGQELSDSGESVTANWSLGLGLDLGPVRPYAGLGVFSDGALFLARISIVF